MFRGRFEHSLDDKGRLSVPSRFREVLSSQTSEPVIVITNFDQCLVSYSLLEWERLEERIVKLPQFDPTVVSFLRYFISGATECPLDRSGRVLIPPTLRALAGIERDCVIAGQLSKFEIWSLERWDSAFRSAKEELPQITQAMAKLGIQL